ncbi:MAG: hypothetical protein K1000chlam2_00097 [Chlamydiae bacterium]|nr:hypothetical protein [Chlamydiota bacterium]
MRFVYFIIIALTSLLAKGMAKEPSTNEFRINLNPEYLVITDQKMLLLTNDFGEVTLSNLQIDERGYYTICQIGFACNHCQKQFNAYPTTCDHCGSEEIDFITLGENKNNDYLTAQAMLCTCLKDFCNWDGKTLLCGTIGFQGSIDSDGNRSASIEVSDTNKDRDISWSARGSIEQDPDRNTSASAEVSVEIGF